MMDKTLLLLSGFILMLFHVIGEFLLSVHAFAGIFIPQYVLMLVHSSCLVIAGIFDRMYMLYRYNVFSQRY